MFFKKKNKTIALPFNSYSGNEPYVFVSYAHADSAIVYPIIKELHNRGILMWYDEGIDVGAEWPQKIADRILYCNKLILFVSPKSIKSHHVRQEINFANSKHKQILPVYIETTTLSVGLEMTLSVFQAIYYYAYKNDESAFYSQLYKALTEGFVISDAESTVLDDGLNNGALLRLDDYGDKTLPIVIHINSSQDMFTIGRFDISVGVKQSDFEFAKETKNISRRHAVFTRVNDGYTLTDLGSKAGTFINGRRLDANTPYPLEAGNHISFGNAGAQYIFEK